MGPTYPPSEGSPIRTITVSQGSNVGHNLCEDLATNWEVAEIEGEVDVSRVEGPRAEAAPGPKGGGGPMCQTQTFWCRPSVTIAPMPAGLVIGSPEAIKRKSCDESNNAV